MYVIKWNRPIKIEVVMFNNRLVTNHLEYKSDLNNSFPVDNGMEKNLKNLNVKFIVNSIEKFFLNFYIF